MRGGNRGALGCGSPEITAMLSAPRALPEWQISLREPETSNSQRLQLCWWQHSNLGYQTTVDPKPKN
jgi:hypothetical protein